MKLYQLTNKSFNDLGVKTIKDLWNKLRKKKDFKGIKTPVFTEIKKEEGEKNLFSAVFSSAKEDRHGDIVEQNFELKNFKKNPVLLDSHDYRSIENVLGKVKSISVKENKLQGKIEFALDNPKGELARKLTDKGFLNTTSIGFRPLEFNDKGDILKSELLEISMVSVPANPDALLEKGEKGKKKSVDGDTKNKNKEKTVEEYEVPDSKGDILVFKKEFENWDQTDGFVRMKVRDISEFDRPLERVKLVDSFPSIEAVVGNLAGGGSKAIQMLFFPKDEGWTIDDARKWFTLWQITIANPLIRREPETPEEKIIDAIKNIKDRKTRALARVNMAVKAIRKGAVRVEKTDSKAEANRLINGAVKDLLKLKE